MQGGHAGMNGAGLSLEHTREVRASDEWFILNIAVFTCEGVDKVVLVFFAEGAECYANFFEVGHGGGAVTQPRTAERNMFA
jgi:hypothetical protein